MSPVQKDRKSQPSGAKPTREERLAQALRANLARRKAQKRMRSLTAAKDAEAEKPKE